MHKAVVLLSGGLDSATIIAVAEKEKYEIIALSFIYGQRHLKEIDCSRKIAIRHNAVEHIIVPISEGIFKNTSLVKSENIDIPKNRTGLDISEIPSTYVPARNTLFLSYALAVAESRDADAIFIGVNALDYSGYPDCRGEYIATFQNMINLAVKKTVQGGEIVIKTPLIDLKKSEIIKLGMSLGVDYSLTHSCYDPDAEGNACGKCDSCIIRRKGFIEAGEPDVTVYSPLEAL